MLSRSCEGKRCRYYATDLMPLVQHTTNAMAINPIHRKQSFATRRQHTYPRDDDANHNISIIVVAAARTTLVLATECIKESCKQRCPVSTSALASLSDPFVAHAHSNNIVKEHTNQWENMMEWGWKWEGKEEWGLGHETHLQTHATTSCHQSCWQLCQWRRQQALLMPRGRLCCSFS